MIVTFNLRHFTASALSMWNITATHPADYLITLYSMDPGIVVAKLDDIAQDRSLSREKLPQKLTRTVPAFTAHVATALNLDL